MNATVVVSVLILGLVRLSAATNPGLTIRVSLNGLNYAAEEAVEVLASKIQGKAIPDQSGTASVKVGKVDWSLSGIRITSFTKPSSSVSLKPGTGLTWSANRAAISLHADWRYKYKLALKRKKRRSWFHKVADKVKQASSIRISDHGSLDVDVSGVYFSLSVTLGMDGKGHFTISSRQCSCNIGDVNVHIHGGASWFYNLFKGSIEKLIRDQLKKILCEEAQKAINENAARNLAKLKLQIPMDKVELDYSPVVPPSFQSSYMETYHKGVFLWRDNPKLEMMTNTNQIFDESVDRMITLWVKESVMNSLGAVLQDHDILQYNLTAKDLPPKDRDVLNTSCAFTCIGAFLPQVKKLYPNSRMAMNMKSTTYPVLRVSTNKLGGVFQGDIKYYVQLHNNTMVYLFTTSVKLDVILQAKIKGQKIVARIVSITPTINVTDSKITGITSAALTFVFNAVAKGFVIPKLNEAGGKGIEIPNLNVVQLVNPTLTLTQGAVQITSDLKYVPKETELHFTSKRYIKTYYQI